MDTNPEVAPARTGDGARPGHAVRPPAARRLSPHVRTALRRIRAEFPRQLTLKAVARDLDRQSEYVGWLFRHETGVTFHQRLTRVRLRHAARLIRSGEKIDAVALLVGYRSKKNFYQQFERGFHATPGEYRSATRLAPGGRPAAALHAHVQHMAGT